MINNTMIDNMLVGTAIILVRKKISRKIKNIFNKKKMIIQMMMKNIIKKNSTQKRIVHKKMIITKIRIIINIINIIIKIMIIENIMINSHGMIIIITNLVIEDIRIIKNIQKKINMNYNIYKSKILIRKKSRNNHLKKHNNNKM